MLHSFSESKVWQHRASLACATRPECGSTYAKDHQRFSEFPLVPNYCTEMPGFRKQARKEGIEMRTLICHLI